MFGAMGFGRAMKNHWSQVTHLASNSGGTWFLFMRPQVNQQTFLPVALTEAYTANNYAPAAAAIARDAEPIFSDFFEQL